MQPIPDLGRLERHVPLAPFTSFRIGGPADLYFEARSADELARAVIAARESGIPWFLLGLGANILIGDLGFRGLVIHNHARGYAVDRLNGVLTAESGCVVWPELVEATVDAGLGGLQHYAGIPSTIGGALWQNLHFLSPAPARERTTFIEEALAQAEILTEEGARRTVGVSWFEFGYDQSILHRRRDVVLSATFRLEPAPVDDLRRTVQENLTWRRERHPPLDSEPSAGSVFKKIEGIGAGRLIDQCGLKGHRIGGAMISPKHANFVVNAGGATAADVRRLIEYARNTVEKETGYRLETEIGFVGEF